MDTQTILQMFKQAIKGGRGPEDEAYTTGRQTQRFQDQVGAGRRPEMTEDEAYTAQRRNQQGGVDARRQYHNMFNPNLGDLSQFSEVDGGTEIEHGRNPHTRIHPSGQPFPDANEFYNVSDPFVPQQVGTQRVGTQRDWSNNPHTRTDWGPELPMNGVPISAEEFGLADQFAPRFPGVDDMQRHRGTGYTVPDAARRDIMGGYDAGRDYGYEGPGQYPADVVDRVLIEEQMRRRNRTMPGSPVNY